MTGHRIRQLPVNDMKRSIRFIVCTVLPVLADQLTKYLAVLYLRGQESFVLIPGVLELLYLENNGAAFSMLRGRQGFFYILTIIFLAAVTAVLRKMHDTKRLQPLRISLLFLTAGAVGNFIDRVLHKYVVDFIYFSLIDFPVFNIADICVTVSVAVLAVLLLFYYKDSDLAFLSGRFRKNDGQGEEADRGEEK